MTTLISDMDQSVKRMLKLIEEDGDSFAKKAEMYYQKRPELISHVEEFYRMYRSLAERYDHVTGELRKNIPSDLQSQGSGISDVGSEPPTSWPSPDQRLSQRKSGPRAAGFEFFLGSGGSNSDMYNKEGDDSSTLDSESESDDSSINNYSAAPGNGEEQGLRRKIIELEVELRDVKEKLRMQQEENADSSSRGVRNGNSEYLHTRIEAYEDEMRDAREKIPLLEEEVARLKIELQKNRSLEVTDNLEIEKEVSDPECKIKTLEGELKVTKEKLQGSEREIANLRKMLLLWKPKLDKEQREVSKLQDRIARYKANLAERDQEIRRLSETISSANQSLSEENTQLQAEISKLLKEQTYLDDNLKEWELRCQSLEEEVRRVKAGKTEMQVLLQAEIEQLKVAFESEYKILMAEKDEVNAKITTLAAEPKVCVDSLEELRSRVKELEEEVEKQREVISVGAEEKREAIRQLCFSLEHYRIGYHRLRQAFVGHRRLPVMAS
ncbi:kinase interacting (KIP1-like) family protein [Actinidia rufa]|uniref:Kinase interacting (KIP1-like) family protein n=1 Tax=Actinidia rufa TaxID=165716 RepID=A0A7J0FST8_9ERIC|nr:kinase interacting (KIP1-like) family protein [Actinidia rufa]